jgi:hypothetical protein
MNIKQGIIPTVIGTAVTATGIALRSTSVPESYRNGIIGFGLANIAIGSAEMINHSGMRSNVMSRVTNAMQMK